MQQKRLILSLALALSLATVNAWGDEEAAVEEESDTTTESSNIEGWVEEQEDHTWTWFGMGYESRREAASNQPGRSSAGSGGPSVGPGSGGGKR